MLPTKFRFIWPNGFRGEDFLEINHSETRIACGENVENLFSEPIPLSVFSVQE
jgi:hypothetical protein